MSIRVRIHANVSIHRRKLVVRNDLLRLERVASSPDLPANRRERAIKEAKRQDK